MAPTQLRLLPGEYRPDWSVSARGPISPVFLALAAGFGASGVALWRGFGSDRAGIFIFVVCGWLVTLCLHEFMHAVAAYWGGDHTVAAKGYLRLDPLRYGHPLLTFILPVVYLLMGGLPLPGGAVLIENHRLRSKLKTSLVSLAGPSVNVAASVILLVVLHLGGTGLARDHTSLWAALAFLAFVEIATAILNLIPIPGLDGYGVVEPWLGREARRLGDQIRPYGLLIMFALLFAIPSTRHLISDWTTNVMDATGNKTAEVGAAIGSYAFQFWRN